MRARESRGRNGRSDASQVTKTGRVLIRRFGVLLPILVALIAWQISSFFVPAYIVPSPAQTAEQMWTMLGQVETYTTIRITLQRITGGFLISALAGVVFGILCGVLPVARLLLLPVIKAMMGIPAISYILFALIWFRSIEMRVWFIVIVIAFPIITINTLDGIRATPRDLEQMVRSFRPSTYDWLRLLIIPAAAPFVFSGMSVSLTFASRIAVFAEAISAVTGIGASMLLANQFLRTSEIVVWTVILVVLLSLMDRILRMFERSWFKWREEL